MRILIVIMSNKGGMVHYTSQLSNSLLLKNNEVTIIAPIGTDRKFFRNDIKIITLPVGATKKDFIFNILNMSILKFLRTIQKEKPDVIHIQSYPLWTAILLPFLKIHNLKIVTTIHDVKPHMGEESFDNFISKKNHLLFSDSIIVHGQNSKKILLKNDFLKKSKIFVVPHGNYIFFTNFKRKEEKEELNQILFFGRIVEYKGLEYLIKAEALVSQKIPSLKIVIAGSGNFNKYTNLIKDNSKYEIYNKFIPEIEVSKLFQRANVVVLPYIDATQSGVVQIAYAFKKPVIATAVGDLPEVVEHDKTGLLVPPRDEKALAEAIIKLLKDKKLRKEMGESGYKKMKEELSWDKIAEKTIEVYKEVITDEK